MEANKELTLDEIIAKEYANSTEFEQAARELKQKLEDEYQRRKARGEEFKRQHNDLIAGLHQMDKIRRKQIEETLDNLPDISPKGAADKILTIADAKRTQLLSSIDKMHVAADHEQRKAKQGDDEEIGDEP